MPPIEQSPAPAKNQKWKLFLVVSSLVVITIITGIYIKSPKYKVLCGSIVPTVCIEYVCDGILLSGIGSPQCYFGKLQPMYPNTPTVQSNILTGGSDEVRINGAIQEVSNQLIVDGALRVKINNTWITIHSGEMAEPNGGTLVGMDLNRDLQFYIGKKAEVYARKTGYDQNLTILGNSKYYLKVVD